MKFRYIPSVLFVTPDWTRDLALALVRLLLGLVFAYSGYAHLLEPRKRAQSIGLPVPFTVFLGAAELAGGLGVLFGVLAQPAALGLILVMFGALDRKLRVWHLGFWGEHGCDGAHYDLLMVAMCWTVVAFGPGRWALWN